MNTTIYHTYQAQPNTKTFVDIKIIMKKHDEKGTAQFIFTTKETKFNYFDQNTCLITLPCSFYTLCSLGTRFPNKYTETQSYL